MAETRRHVVVTGAKGYIGSRLAERLLDEPALLDARFTFTDVLKPEIGDGGRVRSVAADLAAPGAIPLILDGGADVLLHLAGILGGAAETDYDLARRVNIDATLNLLEGMRRPDRPPRVVFASSVAVFGPPLPPAVNDDTIPLPLMNYGAQKRMIEIVVEQFSRRGDIDGIAIRLPGIVARPDADARMKSAFLNTVFFDYEDGRDVVLPVSPQGTTWLISAHACVEAFVHAVLVPAERLPRRRAFTLPAQCVEMQQLVAALAERFPSSPTVVRYEPDDELDAQFARQPPLTTVLADGAGFLHDGDLATLVRRASRTRKRAQAAASNGMGNLT